MPTAAKLTRWEYKVLRVAEVVSAFRSTRGGPIEHDEYDGWVQDFLCSLGAEGWEVVCISPFQDRALILKRPVASEGRPRARRAAKAQETSEAEVPAEVEAALVSS